jgi:hypothetical protein
MAPHSRPDHPLPPDDGWLGPLLKAEADRYEPDHERIMQRIREGADRSAPRRPIPAHSFRRSGLLIPAAAASLVALIAGAITVVHQYNDGPRAVGVATQSTGRPTSAPTTSAGPSPTTTQLGSAVSTSAGSTSATGTKSSGSGSGSGSVKASVELTRAAVPSGKAISLPGDAVDWIVAGSRADTETERSLYGGQQISGPHLTGNPAARSAPGPFTTSWSGGMPDQSRLGSTNWLTVTGPVGGPETGLLLKVPATSKPATLVLYVGAGSADGNLKAKLTAQGTATQTALKAGPSGTGYIVTIHFQTNGPSDTLAVQLISGSGGSIALAAAVLH